MAIIRSEKADRSANQSANAQNEILHANHSTDALIFKDTIEICVSDFEDLVRADTKMQILTELFEKRATVTQDVLYIILGVDGGRK